MTTRITTSAGVPIFGHSRGRWEGDTLVVEVTNFPKTTIDYRGAGGDLTLIEPESRRRG